MSAAVCPSCGVAVVPGYVKCPKCHRPLPRRKSTVVEGGTAVDRPTRLPMLALIAVAVVGAGIIAYLGLRGSDKAKPGVAAPTESSDDTAPAETGPTEIEGPSGPSQAQSAAPDPAAVADSLERALKRERLWSTVSVEGSRVEVRSGSCTDPKLGQLINASVPSFKAAGLTKLRCLEQSGQVVSDRDL